MTLLARKIINDFFDGRNHSFRHCYTLITGDRRCTGKISDCDPVLFREALGSSSLPAVLGDALNRQIVREYQKSNIYDVARKISQVVNAADFRNRTIVRWGSFDDLPIVAEGAEFQEGSNPVDWGISYPIQKRGNLYSITLEAIKNDDVGLIRSLPKKIVEAAKRTFARFVLEMIRTNAAIYDGNPLFCVAHNNLGSQPLSAVSLAAGRLAIRKQPEFGGADPIMVEPKYLLVPYDQEEGAHNLFTRGQNQDRTFLQNTGIEVLPVWYWTDPNDWVLATSPDQYPCIQVAFVDGKEEPELFVAEDPSVGQVFSRDAAVWKVRHAYGGRLFDYRGFFKSVVP